MDSTGGQHVPRHADLVEGVLASHQNRAPRGFMSETALVDACLRYLRLVGCFAWRVNTGAMTIRAPGRRSRFVRFNQPGTSDILGLLPEHSDTDRRFWRPGRFLAVECKRHPNSPTVAQQSFLESVRMHGGLALVIFDVGELVVALQAIGLWGGGNP